MEHAVSGCPVRAAFPETSRRVVVTLSLAAALLGIFLSGPSSATDPFTGLYASGGGPNRAGTLVLHANPSIEFTNYTESYCDSAGVATCPEVLPDTERDELIVVHVLAAFSPDSSPRLSGVVFGLQYPPSISIVDVKDCADFSIVSEAWPSSGSGVILYWDAPQTDLIVDVYWFSVEISAGESGLLDVTPHPTHGAYFADEAIPAHLDPVTALGSFGFHRAGSAPCAGYPPESGACCLPTGICIVTDFDGCGHYGGEFLGDGVPCDPNPCDQPEPSAFCLRSGACIRVIGPNPFRGSVRFQLASSVLSDGVIDVLDVGGRVVTVLRSGPLPRAEEMLEWDGRDAQNRTAPAGLYWLRIRVGERSGVRPVVRVE